MEVVSQLAPPAISALPAVVSEARALMMAGDYTTVRQALKRLNKRD